jgi:hypothetical protein
MQISAEPMLRPGFRPHCRPSASSRGYAGANERAADPLGPDRCVYYVDPIICVIRNATLLTALIVLVPVCMLFSGSAVMFVRTKTIFLFLQLLGAGCLIVDAITHIFEAFHLFPWMRWGDRHSVGHYLDLGSAILGLTLFPTGYFHALIKTVILAVGSANRGEYPSQGNTDCRKHRLGLCFSGL